MRFDILTLFPDMVERVLGESVIGRACKSGAIEVNVLNLRDWSRDKHRRVDDTTYGGGMGMLIAAPVVTEACEELLAAAPELNTHVVYMSPGGRVLNHDTAVRLSGYDRLIIICGHYEGVDSRVLKLTGAEEISIGDYVLTGGELPACILTDCVSRLCPGVLSADECHENESIASGMVEYPQYTRPAGYRGLEVPEVLKNGNHRDIARWRSEAAFSLTKSMRPELLGIEYLLEDEK